MVCGAGCRPRTANRLAGYSSWYNRYQNIDEALIQEDQRLQNAFPHRSLFRSTMDGSAR